MLNKDLSNNVLTFYTTVTKEKPEYWVSKEVFFTMPEYGFLADKATESLTHARFKSGLGKIHMKNKIIDFLKSSPSLGNFSALLTCFMTSFLIRSLTG